MQSLRPSAAVLEPSYTTTGPGRVQIEPSSAPATAGQPRLARVDEFEAYRGVAALLVVVFHAYQYSREGRGVERYVYEGTPFHAVLHTLEGAVAWFFALSGFLIALPFVRSAVEQRRPQSVRGFLVRRAIRILPLYYLAIVPVWTWRYYGDPQQWVDLLEHLTFTQIFDRAHIFWTIGPAWSLSVEVLFYVLVGAVLGPLAYAGCRRLRTATARLVLLATVLAGLGVSSIAYKWWALYIAGVPSQDSPVYFGLMSKLDTFALGMLAAVAVTAAGGRPLFGGLPAFLLRLAGAGLLWMAVSRRDENAAVELYFHTLSAAAFVLVLGSTVLGRRGSAWERSLAHPVLQHLGAISYSLYLWHEPLLIELGKRGVLISPAPESFPINALVLVGTASAVASLSYYGVERPTMLLRHLFTAEGRLVLPESVRQAPPADRPNGRATGALVVRAPPGLAGPGSPANLASVGRHAPPTLPVRGLILVADRDHAIRVALALVLRRAGYDVIEAPDGQETLDRVAETLPDLIITDAALPCLDGLALLERLRADPATRRVPLILLEGRGGAAEAVAGFERGADDYLRLPLEADELLAHVAARLERPPVPRDELLRDLRTGLLSEPVLLRLIDREARLAARTGGSGCVAFLDLYELPRLRERLGPGAGIQIARQAAELVLRAAEPLGYAARDGDGRFALQLPHADSEEAHRRLEALAGRIGGHCFMACGEQLRLTPMIGYATYAGSAVPAATLRERALAALHQAATRLDLQPVRHEPMMDAAWAATRRRSDTPRWWRDSAGRLRLPLQIAAVSVVAVLAPFLAYTGLGALGLDVTAVVYLAVVMALLLTAWLIWVEGLLALHPEQPPERPGAPYPPASAIIAAYLPNEALPNEAGTVLETVEAFLRVEYPGPFQVILAYNTPRDLPIEAVLRAVARRDRRFLPLRVGGSTSKSQNVNAALAEVSGEFVGVFDADHHPDPDSFVRAWRWLSNGNDVVQGHCLVRNGDDTWVARMVAVEFESIYAVIHPGRARLHHFGIFGGTNGYWRTDLLRQTRMHGFMLTEDIDASLRVIEAGYRIASDPRLVSRELAPVTLEALWNQRMRWAQGWYQVSLKHLWRGLRSPRLTLRQKLGFAHLLGWREFYPWLSIQILPIIAYWSWKHGGLDRIDWLVPIFVLTSLFALSVGPGQTVFAYLLADPQVRRRTDWFIFYLVASSLFYTPLKNLISLVAQFKELMRERQWKVTPRAASAPAAVPDEEANTCDLATPAAASRSAALARIDAAREARNGYNGGPGRIGAGTRRAPRETSEKY